MARKRRGGRADPIQPLDQLVNIQLDPVTWNALHAIAAQQARPVRELVAEIAQGSLDIAIRVYIEQFYRSSGTPTGPVDT